MKRKSPAKSRERRIQLLHLFDWVPDRVMISLQYRMKLGRWPNLKNPERFSEKLQWYKLNYHNPLMARCVDKYDVRSYVIESGLSEILVPLIGVFESAEEVDFSRLPEHFVLKDVLGGGGNDVLICSNRDNFDEDAARTAMRKWTKRGRHRKHPGREWVYDRKRPSRIICEEYLEPGDSVHGLTEFKFFCFGGKPRYINVISDRDLGKDAAIGIFEADGFRRVNAWRADERRLEREIEIPQSYSDMLRAAETLSAPFPEVRVDFYDLGERGFRFGELTFFAGSGYFPFAPDEFDYQIGSCFKLPTDKSF